MAGTDLKSIGAYRTQTEPMQVVSGPVGKQKIHFEAPPSPMADVAPKTAYWDGTLFRPAACLFADAILKALLFKAITSVFALTLA